MSFPQGPIWQTLRQRALDAVPPGSQSRYSAPVTLRQWQTAGAYTVATTAPQRVEIAAFSDEIGGVLLVEAEHFLDHAAEHQVVLFKQRTSDAWTSSAWQTVTVYYWAYFALLALTRLVGDSIWYVDDSVAAQLSTLAPAGSARVGAGPYRLRCGRILSVTQRQLDLRRAKGRSHDALWKLWGVIVDDLISTSAPLSGSEEERLFIAIRRAATTLGPDWPSELRNVVNYRPGFAYRAGRMPARRISLKHIPVVPHGFSDHLSSFESSVAALTPNLPVSAQPDVVARLLVDYTLVLHTLSRAVYSEVVDRSGLDKRWQRNRSGFLEKHGVSVQDGTWPCE